MPVVIPLGPCYDCSFFSRHTSMQHQYTCKYARRIRKQPSSRPKERSSLASKDEYTQPPRTWTPLVAVNLLGGALEHQQGSSERPLPIQDGRTSQAENREEIELSEELQELQGFFTSSQEKARTCWFSLEKSSSEIKDLILVLIPEDLTGISQQLFLFFFQ